MHEPESPTDFELPAPARLRLAYDELLANQLALAVIRQRLRRSAGRRLTSPGKLRQAILANVEASVSHLRHGSEILEQLEAREGLAVVGAVYALETGVVEFLDGVGTPGLALAPTH